MSVTPALINVSYNIYTDRMDIQITFRDGTQRMVEPMDLEAFREYRLDMEKQGTRFYDRFGKELGGE